MSSKKISQGEQRFNRIISIVAWSAVGIAIVVFGLFYLFSASHVSTNNAQIKQYITPVSSKVSGYIKEVRFQENQAVKKGDTLVVIDNREYKNQMDMAEAQLQSSEATVSTFQQSVQVKASDLSVVQSHIDVAKIEVWRTEQDYQRFKNLVEQDAATVQQFEMIEASYKQAKAKLQALERELKSAAKLAMTEEAKVAPIRSQVMLNKAHLKNAELTLSYSYVLAPYDGWVGTRNIQEGQLIKDGQALVQVVSKEKWVIANYKETQIGLIDTKKDNEIKADAFPDITFLGVFESFSPAAGSDFSLIKPDNATGNFVKIEQRFPVKIRLKESPSSEFLKSGMNVSVAAQKLD